MLGRVVRERKGNLGRWQSRSAPGARIGIARNDSPFWSGVYILGGYMGEDDNLSTIYI